MKVKDAHETAGIGEGHEYLGHFAKKKYINKGHNDVANSDGYVVPRDDDKDSKDTETGSKPGLLSILKMGD
jgi:hypothetical protein